MRWGSLSNQKEKPKRLLTTGQPGHKARFDEYLEQGELNQSAQPAHKPIIDENLKEREPSPSTGKSQKDLRVPARARRFPTSTGPAKDQRSCAVA